MNMWIWHRLTTTSCTVEKYTEEVIQYNNEIRSVCEIGQKASLIISHWSLHQEKKEESETLL